ncbi:MAG: hypothetical protein P4L90_24935 [Rhodopila sp.]|nr:hypothetical protein [Rhodopila sp.]
MAAALTSRDVARLISEPSADLRAELAGKVAADLTGNALTGAERALAQDIVRVLARDVEGEVRASLSRGLRHSRDLPDVIEETGFVGQARDLERFRARVISRVLTLVDSVDVSDADYLIDKSGDVLVHAPAEGGSGVGDPPALAR